MGYVLNNGYLDAYMVDKLLDTLGVSPYLNDVSCSSSTLSFVESTNGWSSGCCHIYLSFISTLTFLFKFNTNVKNNIIHTYVCPL